MSRYKPSWRWCPSRPRWWPWRVAVLTAPYGPVPAGYRWRVSLWPWPTDAETEAALLHDWEYECYGNARRGSDDRFIRSLPAGALRWVCRRWVTRRLMGLWWWT